MRQENEEIVRRLYDQWAQGDFSAREPFGEDLEFEIEGSIVPDPVRARGVDGMAKAWRENLEAWTDWHAGSIEELRETGDRVVVVNRIWGRGKHSGAEVSERRAAVFTFRDTKIVGLLLTDRDRALEAAGLAEQD